MGPQKQKSNGNSKINSIAPAWRARPLPHPLPEGEGAKSNSPSPSGPAKQASVHDDAHIFG